MYKTSSVLGDLEFPLLLHIICSHERLIGYDFNKEVVEQDTFIGLGTNAQIYFYMQLRTENTAE